MSCFYVKQDQDEGRKKLAAEFYGKALQILIESKLPFLLGGAFALNKYTTIYRDTKDLDLFCKPADFHPILKLFSLHDFKIEITDSRWIGKVFKNNHYIDLIFNSVNNICAVDESWFEHAQKGELYGLPVLYISPEEFIWSKIYVQNRDHHDGADINHIIVKKSKEINWKRVLARMEQHWHLLLAQFLNFQFIYPSERDAIPKWLFDELLQRAKEQYEFPISCEKVCRGPLIDHSNYNTDITEWGYKIITVRKL